MADNHASRFPYSKQISCTLLHPASPPYTLLFGFRVAQGYSLFPHNSLWHSENSSAIHDPFEVSMATTTKHQTAPVHTNAWVLQTYLCFFISIAATLLGILYMPNQDNWVKGYLLMGMLFSVGSTVSLSKTVRDIEESKRMISRIDEAKLERLLANYDPFKDV
jgi:hypothetical protein